MRIVAGHRALRASPQAPELPGSSAVVIGNFDGVHRGHQVLFERARQLVAGAGPGPGTVIALTFEPHPARFLAPERAPPLIATRERKRELLASAGVDLLVEEPFDRAFSALSPTEFVEQVLVGGLHSRYVCVGYDFTFGKARAGNTQLLGELLAARGAEIAVIPAFSIPDPTDPSTPIVCSSTFVRRAVQAGQPERAAWVLGRDPEVEGEVVHGAGRGRTIGVPTANVQPAAELVPATGVYAAWVEILEPAESRATHSLQDALPDGSFIARPRAVIGRHPAAVNVGYNPTFASSRGATSLNPSTHAAPPGPNSGPAVSPVSPGSAVSPVSPVSIEAHLIRTLGEPPFAVQYGDLYGRTLRLQFRARLRAEQRFSSVAALVAQIQNDIDAAASLLGVVRARE